MKIVKHQVVPNKLAYAQGQRTYEGCILCGVQKDGTEDTELVRLVVYRGKEVFVTLNLYPYNPGHVMVVPCRHVEDLRALEPSEVLEMHELQLACLDVLDSEYHPSGYNLGFNVGQASGASIPHVHLHVVPRHKNELGFFDILSDSRVVIEHPQQSLKRLQQAFSRRLGAVVG